MSLLNKYKEHKRTHMYMHPPLIAVHPFDIITKRKGAYHCRVQTSELHKLKLKISQRYFHFGVKWTEEEALYHAYVWAKHILKRHMQLRNALDNRDSLAFEFFKITGEVKGWYTRPRVRNLADGGVQVDYQVGYSSETNRVKSRKMRSIFLTDKPHFLLMFEDVFEHSCKKRGIPQNHVAMGLIKSLVREEMIRRFDRLVEYNKP